MTGVLPTGTVTFLFTDIEGSTRLWDERPAEMAVALERHDAIVRGAIDRHDGHVFSTGGDGYGVVFERAERAVSAAVDAQLALLAEPWPERCPVRVRMGVHSGETRERQGDYFGPTVNRCARIMGSAKPTQILVSDTTRGVVSEFGSAEIGFTLSASVVLRGTADRVSLYGVLAPGLPVLDPALVEVESAGNVVAPLTVLVGRGAELAGLSSALDECRLVTLIGVGGVGKTRLAIEAALEAHGPRDGVWLVELGLIDASDGVAAAVSDALRLRPTPGVGFDESVADWCSSRELLVVLDNCEHVLRGAAGFVGSLLPAAPGVKVLATSREPLMVTGEHVVPVPSLSLEGADGAMSEAMELFVQRARSELPAFDPAGDEDALRDICTRLDGIPLALELAAARVRALSVQEISRRLDERFRLLTGGRSGSVERHATLRAAVDWSYDLLHGAERDLFDRLSVFAGRFGVDDVVGLHGGDADEFEIIDTLTALVDRSLVVRDDQRPDYRMLETLRAYGRERLALADRIDDVRADHADLMAAKAHDLRTAVLGPSEAEIVALLKAQLPDYGAAAEWAIDAGHPEIAASIAEDCLRVCWDTDEPGRWIAPLTQGDASDWAGGAPALGVAAHHALFYQNDVPAGAALARRAIELDATNSLAHAQACLACMFSGDRDHVVGHAERSLAGATDPLERALALLVLGHALIFVGRTEDARAACDDLRHLGASTGYPTAIAFAHYLAGILQAGADPAAALTEFEEGLDAIRGMNIFAAETSLRREMIPVLMRTDPRSAVGAAADVLENCDTHNDTGQVNNALAYIVTILHDLDAPQLAAQVAGHVGHPLLGPSNDARYLDTEKALQSILGDAYETHRNAGTRRSTWELVTEILEVLGPHR